MPLLMISYALQFFDKTALGYTAILGIQQDIVGRPPLLPSVTSDIS